MMKKILILSNRLEYGGAEIYAVNIANAFHKKGYTVYFASSGGKLVECLNQGIRHFELPINAKQPFDIYTCSRQLNRLLKIYPVDLIHSNSVFACLIAKMATVNLKTKVINTVHSWGTNKNMLSAKIVNYSADKVIAVSHSTARCYIENGLNPDKVTVIHNGIDTDKFQKLPPDKVKTMKAALNLAPEAFVIINIARMEEERKGHHTLLEGAKQIIARHPDVQFLLVGDGVLNDKYQHFALTAGIKENMHFLGNRSDIVELLSVSDVFCLPSDWEGLPLVIAEAMACSVPVVATAVSGVPEIVVDGETGYLIPPKNPDRLAAKLSKLIDYPEVTSMMAKNSRERILKHFSLDNLISRIEDIYAEL
jgi:glycosyltransferase involved in cell wall biosynthesis